MSERNKLNLVEKIPPKLLSDLKFISEKLKSGNHECFVVGGGVRDLILGRTPKEFDLTTSASPEEVKKTFQKVIETGIKHGTVTVLLKGDSYEITTFRRDIDYVDGRRPEKIEFGVSLSEDLKRRDFTMNAIALNVLTGELTDEHNGLGDISEKIIRTIGDPVARFTEDGLRPVRAIRFMSTLSFAIEKNTYDAIRVTRHVTKKVSTERFHDELNKILLSGNPFVGIQELFQNDIFSLFLDRDVQMPKEMQNLKKINLLDKEPISLRLHFLNDFLGGRSLAENDLRKLKYSNENIKEAVFFFRLREICPPLNQSNEKDIRIFLSVARKFSAKEKLGFYLNAFYSYLKIDNSLENVEKFRDLMQHILESDPPLVISDLAIDGNSILENLPQIERREIGKILQNCLEKVLDDPSMNTARKLIEFIS